MIFQATLTIKLERKRRIQGFQIVNNGSAFVEIQVSNTDSHGRSMDYQVSVV